MFRFVRVFSPCTFVSSLYKLNIQSLVDNIVFDILASCLCLFGSILSLSDVVLHGASLYTSVCFQDTYCIGFCHHHIHATVGKFCISSTVFSRSFLTYIVVGIMSLDGFKGHKRVQIASALLHHDHHHH